MAMPSGNFVISDKMQFPNGAGATVSGEIHHPRPWFPDERDGFISWLRAEFAAANAIIDSLCHHLRAVSDPGEYDPVIGCLHQRRSAWSPVLHMQQYFPISEIMLALQQVAWRRQQRIVEHGRVGGKEFKRSGLHSFGSRQGQRAETTKESYNVGVDSQNHNVNAFVPGNLEKKGVKLGHDVRKFDDKGLLDAPNVTDASLKSQVDNSLKTSKNTDGANHPCTESPSEDVKDEKRSDSEGTNNLPVGKNGNVIQNQNEENLIVSPKTFSAMETIDGKMVNVAEGLNLYGKLLVEAEVSKLISLINDLRATGKRGQFPGPTFVFSKRPCKGHGREMIQLGVAVSDIPSDENPIKDRRLEPIPGLLQGLIDRLMKMQITPLKPDSCIIDIFNEGDHSQPHSFPHLYGRPICVVSLNDCDMVFGTTISSDRPGTYRGALRLNVSSGSLLVMQGNSTDIAKRAIPSIRKERILLTFLKSHPRKAFQGDSHHHHHHHQHHHRLHPQSAAPQAPNWGPLPPNRPANHNTRSKHYAPVPTTGVLAAPPIRAQLPPNNGIPPLFVPPPVATPMAFPTSMPFPSSRGPPPRIPVPGTGVFLPPPGSSGSPPLPSPSAAAETSPASESTIVKEQAEKENGDV